MAKKELDYYKKIDPSRQRSYNMSERVLMIIATIIACGMVATLVYLYVL